MEGASKPLISVIVPVYNAGAYLDACLDSLSRQSYPCIEAVIVDDGSTDGSGAVCDRWKENFPSWTVIHRENGGPAAARNVALDHCHGEFIAFVDSDDLAGPDYILNLWKLFADYPQADVAMSSFVRKLNGNDTWRECRRRCFYTSDEMIEAMLYQTDGTDSGPWCKLFRSRLFDGLRFKEGIIYEDLDLMVKLYAKSRSVIQCDAADYFYRINPDGLMGKNSFNESRLDVLKVTDEICRAAHSRPWLKAAEERRFSANCNILALLYANGMADSPCADACWEVIKKYRHGSLTDSKTRLKSKIGALVSYLGKSAFGHISSLTV